MMMKRAAEQAAEIWRKNNPEKARAVDGRRFAAQLLTDLNVDLKPQRSGKVQQLLDKMVSEYAAAVEAALRWTMAKHGSAQQLVRQGSPVETIVYPPHVDAAVAMECNGQPAGWRQGVILIRAITTCDKSITVTSDIENVKAANA